MDLPPRPQPPPPAEKRRGSWLGLLLALAAGLLIAFFLVMLTMGFLGLVILIAGGVFGFAALHYLVWGWWLSSALQREQAEKEAAQRQNEAQQPVPREPNPGR